MTLKLLALALGLGTGWSAWGQGFAVVNFANSPSSAFYDADGVTRLAGSNYLAALFYGPVGAMPEQLTQLGPPSRFTSNGLWAPGTRTVPTTSPLESIVLQVRFWDSENGAWPTFEAARDNGAKIGVSTAIIVTLLPPPAITQMSGLQSAALMPALVPTITLTRGAPGLVTDSSTVAHGTQLTTLCGAPVGLNRWFRITSPYSGETFVTTAGSSMDTVMSAYTGSIINPSTLTAITCNDDRAGATTSELRFTIQANTLYLLCIAGKNGATGTIRLNHTLLTGLQIRRTNTAHVELSWPADASNFVAEAASELSGSWQTITNTPTMVNDRRLLQLDCAGPREVYRLRLRN
ncbi:MAG TPA: hypothetical protein VFC26_13645 [Verrucomicrobiae bacterium]|nr:hypothetical protein [Verrucomicrobiae bacterium]